MWRTWLPWLLLAIAVIATAVVYWPGVTGGWVFDDYPNIIDNAAIHITSANSTLAAWVNSALSSPASFLHRPLASLTFSVNWYFGGGDPWPFKVTNIVIHLVNGVLLYFMLRALLRLVGLRNGGLLPSLSGRGGAKRTHVERESQRVGVGPAVFPSPPGRGWRAAPGEGTAPRNVGASASVVPSPPTPLPAGEGSKAAASRNTLPEGEGSTPIIEESAATRLALIVAAAWMLLPINLMAVLYVVQRMESLCQVFVLAGLWAYLHGRWMMLTASDARRDRHGFALAVSGIVLGTLLGLTSKETAVLLPVFAFLVEWILLRFAATTLASSRVDSPSPWRSLGKPPSAFAFAGLQSQSGSISGDAGDVPKMTREEMTPPPVDGMAGGGALPPSPPGRGAGGEGPTLAHGSTLRGTGPSPGAARHPLPEGEGNISEPSPGAARHPLPEGEGNISEPSPGAARHPLPEREGNITEPSPGAARSRYARFRFAPSLPEGERTRPEFQFVIPGLPEGQNPESMVSASAESNGWIPDSARDKTAGGSGMTTEPRGAAESPTLAPSPLPEGEEPNPPPQGEGMGGGGALPPSPPGRGAGGEGPTLAHGSTLRGTGPSPGAARHPLPEGEGNISEPSPGAARHPLPEGEGNISEPSPAPSSRSARVRFAPPLSKGEGKATQDSRIWTLFTITLFIPGALGFAWLMRAALRASSWSGRDFTLSQRLLTECRVLVDYLHWTLFPNPMVLSLYHDEIVKSTGWLTPWTTLGSMALLAALIAIAVLLRNRRPLVSLGIGWFFAAQLLTATIVPLELVYEQRMYFASIGVLLAVGALLLGLRWKIALPILRGFVVGVALLWFAVATNLRAQEWSNPLRLAVAEADRHPESARAVYEAGRLLLIASNYQPGKALDESRKYLAKAAAIPGSSSLPEQALIMIADHHHQGADADYWNSMIRKLRDQPTRQEDISALISLTNCYGADICKFNVWWLQRAYAAALSRPHPIARLDGAYADFERDLMHNDSLATRYLARAVAGDPDEPAYRVDLAALYARQGETEKALEQIDALRRMNLAGRLDRQIAVLERLAEQGKVAAPSAK